MKNGKKKEIKDEGGLRGAEIILAFRASMAVLSTTAETALTWHFHL